MHGKGTCTFSDGTKYTGDFKLNEFDGYGKSNKLRNQPVFHAVNDFSRLSIDHL